MPSRGGRRLGIHAQVFFCLKSRSHPSHIRGNRVPLPWPNPRGLPPGSEPSASRCSSVAISASFITAERSIPDQTPSRSSQKPSCQLQTTCVLPPKATPMPPPPSHNQQDHNHPLKIDLRSFPHNGARTPPPRKRATPHPPTRNFRLSGDNPEPRSWQGEGLHRSIMKGRPRRTPLPTPPARCYPTPRR